MKLLCDLLKEETIVCPLGAVEKWAAIEACAKTIPLIASGEIGLSEAIDSIREREAQKQSTLLDNGVAIPHGMLPDPAPVICALGVSKKGVDYGEGEKKASLLFAILGSRSARKDYLDLIAQITRLMRRADLRKHIIQAKSSAEVYNLIKEAEKD